MVAEEFSPTRRHIDQHASERQSVGGILDMSDALVQCRPECKLASLPRSCVQRMVVEELSPTRRHIDQHTSERQSVSGILDMSDALVQYRQHDA